MMATLVLDSTCRLIDQKIKMSSRAVFQCQRHRMKSLRFRTRLRPMSSYRQNLSIWVIMTVEAVYFWRFFLIWMRTSLRKKTQKICRFGQPSRNNFSILNKDSPRARVVSVCATLFQPVFVCHGWPNRASMLLSRSMTASNPAGDSTLGHVDSVGTKYFPSKVLRKRFQTNILHIKNMAAAECWWCLLLWVQLWNA